MAEISFITTQNVKISYRLADLGDRILGFLIDWGIKILYKLILLGIGISGSFNSSTGLFFYVLIYMPIIFYSLVFEYFLNGQTPGKMIVKTKVIREDGGQPTFGQYSIRWLFRVVDMFLLIGLIVAGVSKKIQRIGDMLAGTVVVKMKLKYPLEDLLPPIPDDDHYHIVFIKAAELTDSDMRIIRDAYKNAISTGNMLLLDNLALKTQQVLGIQSNMEPGKFIRTIMDDYSYYHSDPSSTFAAAQPEAV